MSNAHVPSITGAPESLAEDQARRTRRYLVQMGIRLVCFLAAIFLADGILWLQLILIAAAVVLPYSAVLLANAGRDRVAYDTSPVTRPDPAALPARAAANAPDQADRPDGTATDDTTTPDGHRVVEHQVDPSDTTDSTDTGSTTGTTDTTETTGTTETTDTTEDDR